MITVERQHKRKKYPSYTTRHTIIYHIYKIHLSFKILSYISIQKDLNKLEYIP